MVSNHSLFRYVTRLPIYWRPRISHISGILPTGSAQPSELLIRLSARMPEYPTSLVQPAKVKPFVLGRVGFRCRFGCRRWSRFGFGIGDADAGSSSSALSSALSPFPRWSSFKKTWTMSRFRCLAGTVLHGRRSKAPASFPRRYLRA